MLHLPFSQLTQHHQLLTPTSRQGLGLPFFNPRYTDLGSGPYAHKTWANEPASDLTDLDEVIDMGYAAPSTTIRNVMSTTGGDFCYFYL